MARNIDDRARDEITAAIRDFVTAGETFTAAHVTMKLRAGGAWAGTFSHLGGVAPEVRNSYSRGDMAGYRQSLQHSMSSDGVFAYHPDGQDPNTVDLRIGGQSWLPRVSISDFRDGADAGTGTGVAPAAAAASQGSGTAGIPLATDLYQGGRAASNGDRCRVMYNNDGNAQLPRAMTRLLGWNPGECVTLSGQTLSGEVTVRRSASGDIHLQATSGALRVRDRALMPFGVGNGSDVDVTVDSVAGTLTLR